MALLTDIDLTLRSEQTAELTAVQFDANMTGIEDAVAASNKAINRAKIEVGDDVGDADATLIAGTSAPLQRWATTLTADRTVTLSTTGAEAGDRFRIVRSAGGSFNINVGTGPLKALAASTWCEVSFDGTAWFLSAYGSL